MLAPPTVQAALGVGELVRLGFGGELPTGAERVGLDARWLERLGGVLGTMAAAPGSCSKRRCPDGADVEPLLGEGDRPPERTQPLADAKPTYTRHWLLALHATARSDDRRDVLRARVNLAQRQPTRRQRRAAALRGGAGRRSTRRAAHRRAAEPSGRPRGSTAGSLGTTTRVRAALGPFVAGLERRLERDLGVPRALPRRPGSGGPQARRQAAGDPLRASQRLEVIEREHRGVRLPTLNRAAPVRVMYPGVPGVPVCGPVLCFHLLLWLRANDA